MELQALLRLRASPFAPDDASVQAAVAGAFVLDVAAAAAGARAIGTAFARGVQPLARHARLFGRHGRVGDDPLELGGCLVAPVEPRGGDGPPVAGEDLGGA